MSYSLFESRRLLALPGGVEVVQSAHARWPNEDSSFLVLLCTNDYLLVRHEVEAGSRPIIGQFRLPRFHKTIQGLSLVPPRIVMLADERIFVIEAPSTAGSCHSAPNGNSGGAAVKSEILLREACVTTNSGATCVAGWQSRHSDPFVIVGFSNGDVSFVDVRSGKEAAKVQIPGCVVRVVPLIDHYTASSFLMISSRSNEHFHICIEDRGVFLLTLPDCYQEPRFLSRFDVDSFLTPQSLTPSGADWLNRCDVTDHVTSYSPITGLMDVFEAHMQSCPVTVLAVPKPSPSVSVSGPGDISDCASVSSRKTSNTSVSNSVLTSTSKESSTKKQLRKHKSEDVSRRLSLDVKMLKHRSVDIGVARIASTKRSSSKESVEEDGRSPASTAATAAASRSSSRDSLDSSRPASRQSRSSSKDSLETQDDGGRCRLSLSLATSSTAKKSTPQLTRRTSNESDVSSEASGAEVRASVPFLLASRDPDNANRMRHAFSEPPSLEANVNDPIGGDLLSLESRSLLLPASDHGEEEATIPPVLTDYLMVTVENHCSESSLVLSARSVLDLTTSNSSKKKDCLDPRVQRLRFPAELLSVYLLSPPRIQQRSTPLAVYQTDSSSKAQWSPIKAKRRSPTKSDKDEGESVREPSTLVSIENFLIDQKRTYLHGFLAVTRNTIYRVVPKYSLEHYFLRCALSLGDLVKAEKVAVLFKLNAQMLYSVAGEIHLSLGQFPQAVRLYQMSKCPQLKRVAHFASYGFITEMLAYIQVLFSSRTQELPTRDRCHLGNMAVLCYVHEILSRPEHRTHLKRALLEFLTENRWYDSGVVIKTLCHYRLFDVLLVTTQLRLQYAVMVDCILTQRHLVSTHQHRYHWLLAQYGDTGELSSSSTSCCCCCLSSCAGAAAMMTSSPSRDHHHQAGGAASQHGACWNACEFLDSRGYTALLVQNEQEDLLRCLTHPDLLLALTDEPVLLGRHLQLMIELLPTLSEDFLLRLVTLYDPSRPLGRLALRCLSSASRQHSYLGSASSLSTDSLENIVDSNMSVMSSSCVELSSNPGLLSTAACELQSRSFHEDHNHHHHNHRSSSAHSSHNNSSCVEVSSPPIDEEDVIKFFIFCLMFLTRARRQGRASEYDPRLLRADHPACDVISGATSSGGVSAANVENPQTISCGQNHVAFVAKGRCYTWGKSQEGRLGHPDWKYKEEMAPTRIQYLDRFRLTVQQVACGTAHTLLLTDVGVFACGSSKYGQLGVGDNVQRADVPQLVTSLHAGHVIRVACGAYHSLALTSSGRLYSWGWAVHGQLGHGSVASETTPRLLTSLSDIKDVQSGAAHVVVLTRDGAVYAFGCNTFGQIGTGDQKKRTTPTRVRLGGPVELIGVGNFQTYALMETSHEIWTWGSNPQTLRLQAQSSRRLRLQAVVAANAAAASQSSSAAAAQSSSFDVSTLTPLKQLAHLSPSLYVDWDRQNGGQPDESGNPRAAPRIVQIAGGANHVAILTDDGALYTAGRNLEGQLGHGNRKDLMVADVKQPHRVMTLAQRRIVEVRCGRDFTVARDSVGRLWAWGQNDTSQLGLRCASSVNSSPRHQNHLEGQQQEQQRVITIRTNKRLLTLQPGARRSELRPTEVTGLPAEVFSTTNQYDLSDLDVILRQKLFNKAYCDRFSNVPLLSTLDDPPYGSLALHTSLKGFYLSYDVATTLSQCATFGDFQAAAKVCFLDGQLSRAMHFQLRAMVLQCDAKQLDRKQLAIWALDAVDYYCRFTKCSEEDRESNRELLNEVVNFWIDWDLPVEALESTLRIHLPNLGYPLGLVLYCDVKSIGMMDIGSRGLMTSPTPPIFRFTAALSPSFRQAVLDSLLQHIEDNSSFDGSYEEVTSGLVNAAEIGHFAEAVRKFAKISQLWTKETLVGTDSTNCASSVADVNDAAISTSSSSYFKPELLQNATKSAASSVENGTIFENDLHQISSTALPSPKDNNGELLVVNKDREEKLDGNDVLATSRDVLTAKQSSKNDVTTAVLWNTIEYNVRRMNGSAESAMSVAKAPIRVKSHDVSRLLRTSKPGQKSHLFSCGHHLTDNELTRQLKRACGVHWEIVSKGATTDGSTGSASKTASTVENDAVLLSDTASGIENNPQVAAKSKSFAATKRVAAGAHCKPVTSTTTSVVNGYINRKLHLVCGLGQQVWLIPLLIDPVVLPTEQMACI